MLMQMLEHWVGFMLMLRRDNERTRVEIVRGQCMKDSGNRAQGRGERITYGG